MTTTARSHTDLARRKAQLGATTTALSIAKALSGALLLLVLLQTTHQYNESNETQRLLQDWYTSADYAVFYPDHHGAAGENKDAVSESAKVAEADKLYSTLDDAGAVYVNADNYLDEHRSFRELPAVPIRVNENYLDEFPIVSESGSRITIDPSEKSWIVLVPAVFKDSKDEIVRYFAATRTDAGKTRSAAYIQETLLGLPVPERFREQNVRIIWIAPTQDVFSFNPLLNPDHGNFVHSPIIEVLTSSNSLVVDRLSTAEDGIATQVTITVNGHARASLAAIDGIRISDQMVDAQDTINGALNKLRAENVRFALTGVAALVLLLMLSASFVTAFMFLGKQTLTVRRLHGYGRWRTYQELFGIMLVLSLAQLMIAHAVVTVVNASGRGIAETLSFGYEDPGLILFAVAVAVVDLAVILLTVFIVESRGLAKRLREL